MRDLKSEFDRLKVELPTAAAGLVEDVWYALVTPRTLHAFRDLTPVDHENRCIDVLRHCLSSFNGEKWPSGTVDHVAWETLVNFLGKSLNQSNTKICDYVDRITNWNDDEKQFARNFADSVLNGNMEEWKLIIEGKIDRN